jgi:hypothetical protein
MDANHHIWRVWATILHRWGLQNLAVAFLESAGPLTLFGAQAVYLGEPMLNGILPTGHLRALADLFEDSAQARAFTEFLREGNLA